MDRKKKRGAVIGASALLLIFILILLAPLVIPQRYYLSWAIRQLESRYPLNIQVEQASLRLVPSPRLKLKGVRVFIEPSSGEGAIPFLEAPQTVLSASWTPLFSKELRFSVLSHKPRIRLIEEDAGIYNTDRLLKGASEKKEDKPVLKTSLAFHRLLLRQAHAQETGPARQSEWALNPKSLQVEEADLLIQKLKEPLETYSGITVAVDGVKRREEAYFFDANADLPVPQLKIPRAELKGKLSYHPANKKLSTEGPLALEGEGLKGSAEGHLLMGNPATLDLKFLLESAELKSLAQRLESDSSIRELGGRLRGELRVTGPAKRPAGTLDLYSDDFNLVVPGKIEIKKQPLSLVGRLAKQASGWEFNQGAVKLGPQSLEVKRAHFSPGGGLSFEAGADRLDLKYLAGILPRLKNLPPAKNVSLSFEGNLPHGGGDFPVSGTIQAEEAILGERAYTGTRADFRYRHPLLHLDAIRANGLGGRIQGNARVDFAQETPAYHFDAQAVDLSVQEVAGLQGVLQGRGNLAVQASGRMVQGKKSQWTQNMTGSGTADFSQVTVPVLNLFERIFSNSVWGVVLPLTGAVSVEKLRQLKNWDRKAQFLKTAFSIKNGALQIREIRLQFPQAVLLLAGAVGLDKSLDLTGDLSLKKELLAGFIGNPKLLQELVNSEGQLKIPLKITGFAHAPVLQPDTAALTAKLAGFVRAHGLESVVRGTKAEEILEEIKKNFPVRIKVDKAP